MTEREKVISGLKHCQRNSCNSCPYANDDGESPYRTCRQIEMFGDALELLKDASTVDAVPVVRCGKWEGDTTSDAYDIRGVKTWAVKRRCSECHFAHYFIEAHMCYAYCPNCGAKMDGERRSENDT